MTSAFLPKVFPKSHFDIFIGIDQTGATNAKGIPKPLPACLLFETNRKVHHSLTTLSSLTFAEIERALSDAPADFKNKKVLICVDSALGLPAELKVSIRDLIGETQDFSYQGKSHGALTAHAFFNHFLKSAEIPQRNVETLVKANSVFKLQPFQKNIGCGTYRVLKDLAQDQSWFSLWPFEQAKRAFTIAEGYPSYFWKTLLNAKTRDLKVIKKRTGISFKTVDHADAFVLAGGALHFQNDVLKPSKSALSKKEGWILGVPF